MSQGTGYNIALYAKTDVGLVRSGNEDNFLALNLSTADTWTPETAAGTNLDEPISQPQGHFGTVLAVTDGMGGALAGGVASPLAVGSRRDPMPGFHTKPPHFP